MKKTRSGTWLVLCALIGLVILTVGGIGRTQGRPFSTALTGAAEAPGPGDPDGTGTAELRLNPGQDEICYELSVTNVENVTAAHIHAAAVGVPGPVVVPLVAPTSGVSVDCASVNRDLVIAIIQDPQFYYVNVHSTAFPGGAVRGQLSK